MGLLEKAGMNSVGEWQEKATRLRSWIGAEPHYPTCILKVLAVNISQWQQLKLGMSFWWDCQNITEVKSKAKQKNAVPTAGRANVQGSNNAQEAIGPPN